METLDYGIAFPAWLNFLFVCAGVINLIFFIKCWIMTNDVREIKGLLKELLEQHTSPCPLAETTTRDKTESPRQPLEPGWAKDLTSDEIARARSLVPKLYAGEVIIKDLSTGMVLVWDKESWEKDKEDTAKFKLIYGK